MAMRCLTAPVLNPMSRSCLRVTMPCCRRANSQGALVRRSFLGAIAPKSDLRPRFAPRQYQSDSESERYARRAWSFGLAGLCVRTAGAEEFGTGIEALELALAGEGILEGVAGGLFRGGVDEDAAGAGDRGEAAGEVDWAAVVVARLYVDRAVRDAGPQPREVGPFALGRLDH